MVPNIAGLVTGKNEMGKTSMEMKKNLTRTKFFSMAGLGLIGFVVLRQIPFKLFSRSAAHKKIKIQIHDLAVKRESRGTIHG